MYICPGLGLFAESYLLFSVGTLKPIWEILYPDCFGYETCSQSLIHSLTYNVVLGIILGMITIGMAANKIGRRAGSITTASFMTGGAIGLVFGTLFLNNDPELLFQSMSWCLFIFGIGVGGEYPLSASSASEKAMCETKERFDSNADILQSNTEEMTARTDIHATNRGKQVILVFSMQGFGIFFNTLTVTLLLHSISGEWSNCNSNDPGYCSNKLLGTNYTFRKCAPYKHVSLSSGATILTKLSDSLERIIFRSLKKYTHSALECVLCV